MALTDSRLTTCSSAAELFGKDWGVALLKVVCHWGQAWRFQKTPLPFPLCLELEDQDVSALLFNISAMPLLCHHGL